jgi:GT2 family glycosyltransferase
MITISIVIYNNNRKELQSLINCITDDNVEFIYVVDNSSSDNLKTFVCDLHRKIIYIQGQGNIGYGAGHNIAIKKSIAQGAKYHLVLNPDIVFERGVIEKLLEFMDENYTIGLVMPKILYPNGNIQYLCKLLPTPADLIFRRFFAFTSWTKKRKERYELQAMNYEQVHFDIPSLSGCFMLFRTEVLEKIMGFDELYFLYMEDIDLCRRAHQVSKTAFYPSVSVVHNYAKGSYKNYKLLRYHIYSAIKYFNKWGWFFDKERKKVNKKILQELNYNSE